MFGIQYPHSTSLARAGRMALLACVSLASSVAARAAATVIDFEDRTPPETISTQYGAKGVLFNNAYLDTVANAHSGTRALRVIDPNGEIFQDVPFVITFNSAQKRVKMFAQNQFGAADGTLVVFDATDTIIGSDGPHALNTNDFNTVFEVSLASTSIMRAELRVTGSHNEVIDDLEFEGDPPPPPPNQPPVITITSPVNGANVDISTLDITGTITGDGLLNQATVTVEWKRPPEQSSAPVFTSELIVTGSGTTRNFSLLGFTGVPLGPITVTVSSANFVGDKGSASATFTNLPPDIINRFNSEGGAAALGDFQFGTGCRTAVYANGAISLPDSGPPTLLTKGLIFQKWLALRTAISGGFGCILAEERTGTGGRREQDFTGGRIVITIANGAPIAFYIPSVFLDALEKRGGESASGIPLADPVFPVEQLTQTWMYQQFARTAHPEMIPTTFEIRGNPPILWIERQSGDLAMDVITTGTVWESFPCDGNNGPCTVDERPTNFPPVPDAGQRFCGGSALANHKVGTVLAPRREWAPILGDYVQTQILGVVKDAHLADEDFRFSHEWYYNCPFETVRPDCPSDWNVIVQPLNLPHDGIGGEPSLFAEGNPDELELEYERFYGDFVEWMDRPAAGDLFFAVGRWIIDCGHDSFRSELHPLFMFTKSKTVTTITDPFTGLVNENPFNNHPATRADIWVNGWWPGEQIEFDLYPPPRPSPLARLVVNKPADRDAVHEINFAYTFEPPGAVSHAHVTVSAPLRQPPVTVWGEMVWQINRGYEGQWYLYWSE